MNHPSSGATPEPRPVRWGVLGPGRIAQRFAQCLPAVPGASLVAVASRDLARAQAFARTHGAAHAHASYQALFDDERVDAVYIATPHRFHAGQALAAVAAGKAVLCEKPLAVNAGEAQAVFDAAQARGVFVMEALWSRFLPAYVQVRRWLAAGEIGELRSIASSFGFAAPFDAAGRLFNPDLAGGALLDIGVYGVSLSQWLGGGGALRVERARATLGATGVDEALEAQLRSDSGVAISVQASLRRALPNALVVRGSGGSITVPAPFWESGQVVLARDGRSQVTVNAPFDCNGFEYQVREVHQCLARGAQQSTVMPWSDTLAVLHGMDSIRRAIGLRYPFEA